MSGAARCSSQVSAPRVDSKVPARAAAIDNTIVFPVRLDPRIYCSSAACETRVVLDNALLDLSALFSAGACDRSLTFGATLE